MSILRVVPRPDRVAPPTPPHPEDLPVCDGRWFDAWGCVEAAHAHPRHPNDTRPSLVYRTD